MVPKPGAPARIGSYGDPMTSGEVAEVFGVDPKTVARWATAGKLPHFWTLGGHRRFHASVIRRLLTDRTEVGAAAQVRWGLDYIQARYGTP